MKKSGKTSVGRRKFLKGAALGGVATLVAGKESVRAEQTLVTRGVARAPSVPSVPPPEADPPRESSVLTVERSGSDFMVDVIKSLGFEFVAANPGSSFRGIHESLINYGGNKNPEFITCCHEESWSRWLTVIRKSKASRCWSWRIAPWVCSMRRWVFTTHGRGWRPYLSCWEIPWTPQKGGRARNGAIVPRMP